MRTHFRWAGLILGAMTAGAVLLAACSAPSSPAQSGTSTADTKPYGSLTIGVNFRYGAIEPKASSPSNFQGVMAGVFDSLVEITPDAQPRPGLAERWEISRDGKTQTFYIRKGVKFHDGSDLTAADVKFSMEKLMETDATHQDSAVWRSQIASVEVKDDYTVILNMKVPLFELLVGFQELSGSAVVLPKKYFEQVGADYFRTYPVGSGPWKVVNYEVGSRIELEAVEGHWRTTPKFKTLTFLSVTEEATKVAMLKTGELDIADVAPDSAPQLKAAGLRILNHNGGAQYFGGLFYDLDNPKDYAFGDVRVRKALSLAVDRKELAEKIYGGYAEPSALFYVPKTAFFFDANVLKPDLYDPDQAKKLLAEAGYPNGFATKIWDLGGGNILSTFNTAIAGYWRKAGVNAGLAPIESAALQKMYQPKHTPPMWNTVRNQFTAGGYFGFEKMIIYHSTKGNFKNHRDLKLDDLIDIVPQTVDPAEKKRLALEAAVIAKNAYILIPFLDMNTLYSVGSKIGGFTPIKNMVGLAASAETMTHPK